MRKLLFSARGRIGRGSFWKGMLLLMLLTNVTAVLFRLLGGSSTAGTDDGVELSFDSGSSTPAALVALAAFVVATWAGVCLGVKRYHDRDKSGFWVLIQFVPVIGAIWYFIEAGCLAGTPGPNRFGLTRDGTVQGALAVF